MQNLLIVGASVRAAAASALRAGFAPWCVDLFGDADLRRTCPVETADDYPRGLLERLANGPPGPWMFTGGLENFPDLLGGSRELWGNSAEVVRAVRDPVRLAAALSKFDMPKLGPGDGSRLVKPRRGSSGIGVRRWIPGEAIDAKHYLQEWIAGVPASAVYVAIDGIATCLGATRQLIGCRWLNSLRPFQYAGSIGPIECPRLDELGQTLVDAFILRGVFGVDFIFDGERIWPIEVNPRYPASMEILERSSGEPLFALVGQAFQPAEPAISKALPADRGVRQAGKPAPRQHGKAILFASLDIVFPSEGPWLATFEHDMSNLDVPFADVPAAGQVIRRGDPVVTLFASGDSDEGCEASLRKIAEDLDRVLRAR